MRKPEGAYPETTSQTVQATQYVRSMDAFQQTLFDDVVAGRHVVGMFPLAQSLLPAYAFTALSLPGMTIVICQDENQIRLHCDTLSLAGVVYPEVAALDGTQTPHLVRDTYDAINQRKTRLLYVTPQMLGTLPFVQMMTHTSLSLVVIEEAQYLLPLYDNNPLLSIVSHLHRLVHLPPVCLLSGPVPTDSVTYFSALFATRPISSYQMEVSLSQSRCVVHCVVSEKQKFGRLQQLLVNPPDREDSPVMPTIIMTPDESSAFQVVTRLDQLGVEPVYLYSANERDSHSEGDNRTLREQIRQGRDVVLVTPQVEGRFLVPTQQVPYRVVYWRMPLAVPVLYSWMAQGLNQQEEESASRYEESLHPEKAPSVTVEVFYSKEDYKQGQQQFLRKPIRIQSKSGQGLLSDAMQEGRREFQKNSMEWMRAFCLSDTCRVIELAGAVGVSAHFNEQYTCGRCDVCRSESSTLNAAFLMKGLQRLLY